MKNLFITLLCIQSFSSLGQIILSEMQSSNNFTISDNMGEFDDWVELHNPTTDTIEIGGLVFKDQLDTWAIPTGDPSTFIPPGGYFLLWADDQEFQGVFHTNFKLASGGEFLGLYESDSVTVIDSITIPAMVVDYSYLQCPGGWSQTNSPTPNSENVCNVGLIENTKFNDLFTITVLSENHLEINVLDYSEDLRTLSICTTNGKEIIKKLLDGEKTILNLNISESNIYVVKISTSQSEYSKKMIFKI